MLPRCTFAATPMSRRSSPRPATSSAEREAEHNLLFGICSSLRETPEVYTGPAYLAAVLDDADRIVGAAIQTPPFRLVLSEIDEPRIGEALALDTLDRDLPGVAGPVGEVAAFVAARVAAGGPPGHHHETDRIFRLDTVIPPRPVAGMRRIAGPADRDLVFVWLEGFLVDAFGHADLAEVESMTERWIEGVAGPSTSGRTATPSRCAGSAARRRSGSGSGRSTRRRRSAAEATRAPSWPQ